ncbi:MAG: putative sensor domain DACNV-containing protein [Pyrinomonadaceae bacterium]
MSVGVTERKGPAYPAARKVAEAVAGRFARLAEKARAAGKSGLAAVPDAATVEAVIDAAFWASLRREEGYPPKISLAFLPPEQAEPPLMFARTLPLAARALARLAPAVERPGIHLGVWHCGESGELCVWGTTRAIPRLCFVLEVVEPGLLVVKYRRGRDPGKFGNVVVLHGDEVKVVNEGGASVPDCPGMVTSLLGFGSAATPADQVDVLVQLAVSMREHQRGGTLLVVPAGSDAWRESVLWSSAYVMKPPFTELTEVLARGEAEGDDPEGQEALRRAVDAVAGLTAVDGAAIINDRSELLAFGAKIIQSRSGSEVERVMVTEPVAGAEPEVVDPAELGGTRHLSAAQFVQDQRDTLALVASQDGRFTVFAWSPCDAMVHAHRVETLLL